MAILSKRINAQNSGNFVVADTGAISATDLQYTLPNGDIFQHTLTRIEEIIVTSGTASIEGKTFAADTWDLSKIGGLPITPTTSYTVPANTIMRLR